MKDNKDKVVNDLLKRISNLEFDVEDKQREIESLKQINEEHKKINGELRVENDRLNNIIEKIREYVKQLIDLKEEDYLKSVNLIYIEKILEILDKANDREDK